MKIILKHFILSFLTSLNLKNKNKSANFFQVFLIRFFFAFPKLRNKFNSKIQFNSNVSSEGLFNIKNVNSSLIVKDLFNKGFNDNFVLNEMIFNEIRDDINFKNTHISFKGVKNSENFLKSLNQNDNLENIIDKSTKNNISHVSLSLDLNKSIKIKKLATSNFFIDIAKNYIGNEQIFLSSLCYISNPIKISETEKKDNAQYYHYDNDYKKFFKVFIYLNDVDSLSGPHSFIKNTHKKRLFKHLISERIDDEEVLNSYGKENIITFIKKKGSLIFEDTFGLHKGNHPIKKSRAMLIFIYGKNQGICNYNNTIKVS